MKKENYLMNKKSEILSEKLAYYISNCFNGGIYGEHFNIKFLAKIYNQSSGRAEI